MLSRFYRTPERNGQTDRQTDLLYQYPLKRDKNSMDGTTWSYTINPMTADTQHTLE